MSTKIDWINRLGKWRVVFTGWQLGTRSKGDPEADAVRDHREVTMAMRAELNALGVLLVRKGIMTADEFTDQLHDEAKQLCEHYSRRFPGFEATDEGIEMQLPDAAHTTRNWKP